MGERLKFGLVRGEGKGVGGKARFSQDPHRLGLGSRT